VRTFDSPEDELAWLTATQDDGGLPEERLPYSVDGIRRRRILPTEQNDYRETPPTVVTSARAERVNDAMDLLPEHLRDIVHAHAVLGMSVRQIACLPWVTVGKTTVWDWLQEGLEQLRTLMEGEYEDGS
jgi:DNA-directed RNA polymerase specialized sigma24 family protein